MNSTNIKEAGEIHQEQDSLGLNLSALNNFIDSLENRLLPLMRESNEKTSGSTSPIPSRSSEMGRSLNILNSGFEYQANRINNILRLLEV